MYKIPVVGRRTVSLVQIQLKWTRLFAHAHKAAVAQVVEKKSDTNHGKPSDPFGLDYLGMEDLVQGLYSKASTGVNMSEASSGGATSENSSGPSTSEVPVTEKYKDWFQKKPNTPGSESEVVRTADFGTIRFDKDNTAKTMDVSDDNYVFDQEEVKSSRNRVSNIMDYRPGVRVARPNRTFVRAEEKPNTLDIVPQAQQKPNESIDTPPEKVKISRAYEKHNFNNLDNSTKSKPRVSEDENSSPAVSVPQAKPKRNATIGRTNTTFEKINKAPVQNFNDNDSDVRMNKSHVDVEEDPVPAVVVPQTKPKPSTKDDTPPEKVVKKVPRVYELQNFNNITHLDMWVVLKHSVVYQNDFLIAINKPYGLPIHSPSSECRHTLIQFLEEFAALGKCEQVFPLHRLDKDTTGVLLLAKSQQAADIIKKKFKDRQVAKKYLAITKNCPHIDEGTVKIPISEGKVGDSSSFRCTLKPDLREYNIPTKQSFSKEAITNFKVLKSHQDCAFLEINAVTGVKHQIRVHLAMALGCPVLGDHKYSHRDKLAPQRLGAGVLDKLDIAQTKVRHLPLHLHCSQVRFTMPDGFSSTSEPVFITARPPHFFMHTLRKLSFVKTK